MTDDIDNLAGVVAQFGEAAIAAWEVAAATVEGDPDGSDLWEALAVDLEGVRDRYAALLLYYSGSAGEADA